MARLFYSDDPLPEAGGSIVLTGAEARHAAVVSRLRPGETVHVADGAGLRAIGPVLSLAPERVEVRAQRLERDPEPRPAFVLAQALAKGGRDELAVQAAVELGAVGVVPWQAARSVVRWRPERTPRALERWRAILREAAKQSMRARVPELAEPACAQRLARLRDPDGGVEVAVLDPSAEQSLAAACRPRGALAGARRIVLAVGPEGGVAAEELEAFAAAGCPVLRLGPHVLRSSTAGPAALAAAQAVLGGWG
ncbi:MAG: 16S rRNA (uracil(1498)-N(3))-methyltransferase [Pseudoclavibacter sp.]|nr:16S rRNA (uracil(1498)-N(3))-methyltransferase [Pseudoclavibacter sp.]